MRALVVLNAALLAGCASAGASSDPAAVTAAADAVLGDVRAGAWNAAFSRLSAHARQQCGSAAGLEAWFERTGLRPESWELRDPRARDTNASVTGQVRVPGGQQRPVGLSFDRDLQVNAFALANQDVCGETSR